MTSGGSPTSVHNKKVEVRHVVQDGGASAVVSTRSAPKLAPKLTEAAANWDSNKAALEIDPESELEFILSHNEATPRCMLTLRHPGTTNDHVAFKVRIAA